MTRTRKTGPLLAALALGFVASAANGQAPAAAPMEQSRAVANGGISATGWMGRIDANETAAGQRLENASLMSMPGGVLHVVTGPAVTYWNPANRATGAYTVKATFTEPKYMNLNNHPHPYGIMIGGNNLGTDQQSYLYCAAYGNGNFIVRGFGPTAFALNGNRGAAHEAVHRAAGPGQPVTQEIAVKVTADRVSCLINGTEVASYPKADVVTAGKLTGTDGTYGIRFAHNTEATVSGLTITRP